MRVSFFLPIAVAGAAILLAGVASAASRDCPRGHYASHCRSNGGGSHHHHSYHHGGIESDVAATRKFVAPQQYPPTGFAAYGIVAFPFSATPETRDRYLTICHAYWAALVESSASSAPATEQMVTVWTVADEETAAEATAADMAAGCETAVDKYDLATAQSAIDGITERQRPAGRGPFLIAWSPPASMDEPNSPVILLNLSSDNSEEQFLEDFQEWRRSIQENPQLFLSEERGFSMKAFRKVLQRFVDDTGQPIIEFLKG